MTADGSIPWCRVDTLALDFDLAAIGGNESVGDPQSEAGAGGGRGMARPAEKAAADQLLFLAGQAGAAVVDREHDRMSVAAARRRGSARRRCEYLAALSRICISACSTCAGSARTIGRLGIQIERHRMAGEAALAMFDRGVDDIDRLDPLHFGRTCWL